MADKTDGFSKREYFEAHSLEARFDSACPYCGGPINGSIHPKDLIAKGTKGWGHAGCVNARWHYNETGGHPLCSTHTSGNLRTTNDWSEVTCQKCLAKVADYEAIQETRTIMGKYPNSPVWAVNHEWYERYETTLREVRARRGLPPDDFKR